MKPLLFASIKFRLIVITALVLVWTTIEAAADKRVALVVGNSAYQNVPQLPNPANDAQAIANLFKGVGFDFVLTQQDVGYLEFKRALRKFEDAASDADIAVVYYAGHGMEIGGVNYIIPVDAKLASDLDAPDEAIPMDRILEGVESAHRLRLVILDACRDNPFAVRMRRQRQGVNRSVVAGLGKVEPTTTGTLIAYAAKAGSTSADGVGDHSPFTTALLNNLAITGLDIRLAFGRVRDEVMKTTEDRQEPFVYGSLGGSTIALVGDAGTEVGSATSPTDPYVAARRDYESFERVGTKDAWQAFLRLHASGPYADLARAQLAKIEDDVAASKAVPQPAAQPAPRLAVTPPPTPINTSKPRPQPAAQPASRLAVTPPPTPINTPPQPTIRQPQNDGSKDRARSVLQQPAQQLDAPPPPRHIDTQAPQKRLARSNTQSSPSKTLSTAPAPRVVQQPPPPPYRQTEGANLNPLGAILGGIGGLLTGGLLGGHSGGR